MTENKEFKKTESYCGICAKLDVCKYALFFSNDARIDRVFDLKLLWEGLAEACKKFRKQPILKEKEANNG